MNPTNFRVRRATLDDVPTLLALWNMMRYPADNLARRVTEFQVVTDAQGGLLGAIGLKIAGKQGLIHSESFVDFSWADQFRPLLWERLMSLTSNHGLARLWTREQAAFYRQNEMARPDSDALKVLPPEWQHGAGEWLTIKLRDDVGTVIKADQEFALFMAAEKERTQRAIQRAKVLKLAATFVALGLFALVIAGVVYLARRNPLIPR